MSDLSMMACRIEAEGNSADHVLPLELARTLEPNIADAVLDYRSVYRGWLNLLVVQLRLNGREEQRPLIEHPCGVAVLPYDPVRRLALVVSQSRTAAMYAGSPA